MKNIVDSLKKVIGSSDNSLTDDTASANVLVSSKNIECENSNENLYEDTIDFFKKNGYKTVYTIFDKVPINLGMLYSFTEGNIGDLFIQNKEKYSLILTFKDDSTDEVNCYCTLLSRLNNKLIFINALKVNLRTFLEKRNNLNYNFFKRYFLSEIRRNTFILDSKVIIINSKQDLVNGKLATI